MHTLFLIFKYRPHLELEWLCTTLILASAATLQMDMTTIVLAIIALLSTAMTSTFTYFMAKTKQKVSETVSAVSATNQKVDDLKVHINSRMDKMIEALEAAALAKGHLAGVEEEKQRRAIQDSERAKGALLEREKEKIKPPTDLKS